MVSLKKLVQTLVFLAPCMSLALPGIVLAQEAHVGSLTGRARVGKDIFERYCFGCHGRQGDGEGMETPWISPFSAVGQGTTVLKDKPRDFVPAIFKCRSTPTGTLPTDEDIFDAITRGFYTTYMPAWKALPANQRADLVAFIKTLSPRWKTDKAGTPISIPPETPLTADSVLRGRELFQKMECWKCHGPEGKGDGPSAPTLTDDFGYPIRPYDFSTGLRFKCGSTNADLYRIFMTGLDGTPMPSFYDQLKPEQAWDLVHFLRTLQVSLNPPELGVFRQWEAGHPGQLKPIGPSQAAGSGR
ncbi:MAG TPA: cytochrome c [Candidatus Sulfotelmatobacter sp.]|nr:cytochrome c [Candidatus Sulfotelmatobacter sp.]